MSTTVAFSHKTFAQSDCPVVTLDRSSECPLLAQSGHRGTEFQCPLLGVKRTLIFRAVMPVIDPNRTFAVRFRCEAQHGTR